MKFIYTLLAVCLSNFSYFSYAAEQAEEIFKQLAPSVYQIRLIDKASGEKSSIGTGFQISKDGLIATNYHVISDFARHPEKYAIQLQDHEGKKSPLTLQSVDVINDLAIVKRETIQSMPFFSLATKAPMKGEELYSLGNPHDLGMIVVPGTYNGLKKESFKDRIHFTGSVNPGMSGGPVVNKNAEVVGINVATSGNQIGFLVPHEKLEHLYKTYLIEPPTSITAQMAQQLSHNQSQLISTLLSAKWESKQLRGAKIPIIDAPFIRCWGDSNADVNEALISAVVANCSLEEDTFLSPHFFTGSIEIEFRHMQSKGISDTKFYQLYQKHIKRATAGNQAGKEDVTEYQCHDDIVSSASQNLTAKTVFCTRAYKDFPALFDVLFISGTIDKNDQALISHFTIAGVKEEMALAFMNKFMEAISWN